MKKLLLLIIILAAGYYVGDRFGWFQSPAAPGEVIVENGTQTATTSAPTNVEYTIQEFVTGLKVPWSIVFTSPSRMLVAERVGTVRAIVNGTLQAKPLHTFTEVSVGGEEGLMSLALHPQYQSNKLVYASLAYETSAGMFVKVVQLKDEGDKLTFVKNIIDKIPGAQFHAGSRIAFGPDNKLYITTGDATDKNLAQRMSSLAGKLLRLNDDGTIPNDNPLPKSSIWSYGHRNAQGIAWHPVTKELYSTEHGPSVFDGPAGGDEINRIEKGGNYGWPLVSHDKTREGTVAPLVTYTPAEAPGSGMFYSGNVFPQFKNNFFFGALKGEGLMRVIIDDNNPDTIISSIKLPDVKFGRIREVVQGPDGYIYFATSNRDGRGKPTANDDRIFRLVPKQ
jgi:aldose sugar dehydrogenase